jgi:hypothetical protein
LSAIRIPSSVEVLCEKSFSACGRLSSVICEPGSKLSRIEPSAFSGGIALSAICIPSSTEVLGERCFSGCDALSRLSFEAGSRPLRIERFAFDGCSSLSSVVFPPQLVPLDVSAFTGANIDDMSIDGDNSSFDISGDFLFDLRDSSSLLFYFGIKSDVMIPNSAESLHSACFGQRTSVCNVTFEFGSKVSRIGDSAFCRCPTLVSIAIPACAEVIGLKCFSDCPKLSVVTFESGSKVSQMGDSAFCGCISLSSLRVPPSLDAIGVECCCNYKNLPQIICGS